MPGMYEVAGPGAGVRGSAGVQIVFRFPSKGWADRAEDNENSHYRAGGEVCVLSSLWQTWSRVASGVGRQTNARRCHYVWAAASEPPAFWPLIVQAFHRQHRATAITHSSKPACNRKDSCPSHILFEALCLSKASGLGDAVWGLMSCGRSSLPCRDAEQDSCTSSLSEWTELLTGATRGRSNEPVTVTVQGKDPQPQPGVKTQISFSMWLTGQI